MKVISLMYHDVLADEKNAFSGFTEPGAYRYKVDEDRFCKQINQIAQLKSSRVFPISSIQKLQQIQDGAVLLTFDDGGWSAYTCIADILEGCGMRGYFFVTAKYIDAPGFVTKEQITTLRKRGHVIGSHSFSHPARMAKIPYEKMQEEWRESIVMLEDILGEKVKIASVPGGYCSGQVIQSAKEFGIELLFTSERTVKVKFLENMAVLGRYTIYRHMSDETVYRLASGNLLPRQRQYLESLLKKILKTVGGEVYLNIRSRLLK